MSKTIKEKIRTALRITLGVCFILSGVMKAVNVYSFAQEIRLYMEAYMGSYFVKWIVEIAVLICTVETITGLLAFRKKYESVVAVFFLGMLSFFVWLTGMNLFCPSLMGSIESCGCFGELIHFSPLASFIKSVVLWVMAIGLILITNDELFAKLTKLRKFRITIVSIKNIITDNKMYVTLVTGALPPLYSYFCFENMEHGYYVTGYIALCVFCGSWCLWVSGKLTRIRRIQITL